MTEYDLASEIEATMTRLDAKRVPSQTSTAAPIKQHTNGVVLSHETSHTTDALIINTHERKVGSVRANEALSAAFRLAVEGNLSPGEWKVLAGVAEYTATWNKVLSFETQQQIAGWANLSKRQTRRALKRLRERGIIIYRPGRWRGDYTLIGLPEPRERRTAVTSPFSRQEGGHGGTGRGTYSDQKGDTPPPKTDPPSNQDQESNLSQNERSSSNDKNQNQQQGEPSSSLPGSDSPEASACPFGESHCNPARGSLCMRCFHRENKARARAALEKKVGASVADTLRDEGFSEGQVSHAIETTAKRMDQIHIGDRLGYARSCAQGAPR